MEPLFSLIVAILAVVTIFVSVFSVALFFQPLAGAVRYAIVFLVGALGGVMLAGALSLLVVGVGATFVS